MLPKRVKSAMIKTVKNIALILGLGYVFFFATFNLFSPKITVKYLGWKPFAVLSNSMEPVIETGSLVIATYKSPNELKKDDIIVIMPEKNLAVVHYLAQKEVIDNDLILRTRQYHAKKTSDWDYWRTSQKDYLGTVVAVIPYLGYAIHFLQSFVGIVTVVLLGVLTLGFKQILRKIDS